MGIGTRPRVAAVLFLGSLALGGALAMRAVGAVAGPSPEPPFALPPELATGPGAPESRAGPVLVVAPGCPWCARELASWKRLAGEGPGVLPTVLVVGPAEDGGLAWVPTALRERVQRDPRGELVGRLGVARVPTTLWADSGGTVREVTTGASPLSLLRRLRSTFRSPEVP